MMYLDMWRSGTFLLYNCKAAFWIQETLPRLSDVERSVVLRSVFAIVTALAYLLFFRGWLVMRNLCTYLYFVLLVCDYKRTQSGSMQQVKQAQSGNSSWRDAIRERQLKWIQSGSSSWSGCNREAKTEADAIGEQQLTCRGGETPEAYLSYVCCEGRTVMHRAILMRTEVRARQYWWMHTCWQNMATC